MVRRDPRPDLTEDSHLWEPLLARAYDDAADPNSLYAALLAFRACGAKLEVVPGKGLALRPGEMGASYAADRVKWLAQHRVRLVGLLESAAPATQAQHVTAV